ncbi:MAG: ATP-binding protein [Candidatus Omnitrophota bacterium]
MNSPYLYFPISGVINAITSILLGVFVITRDKKNPLNITYFLFCVSVALWSIFYALWLFSDNAAFALFCSYGFMAGAIFIPIFYLHHLLILLGQNKKKRHIIQFSYTVGILFLYGNFTRYFIKGVSEKMFFKYWPDPGILYGVFLPIWISIVIYGVITVLKAYTISSGIQKMRLRYILLAAIIGWTGGATNYPLWYNVRILPIGNILVSVYILLTTYAIIKYRLLDINIAITRMAIFTVVYTLVLGIPFGLAGWFRDELIIIFGQNWFWLPMIVLLGLATVGPFIYLYLQHRAENRLLKEQRQYQTALRELSRSMTRIRNTDELIKLVGTTLVQAVKTSQVAIYLKDDEYNAYKKKFCYPENNHVHFDELFALNHPLAKVLNQHNKLILAEELGKEADKTGIDFSLAIPCFIEGNLLAFIVLGAKPAHQIYTQDDLTVFETLSYSMALSIENCFFWQEIEARQRKERIQEMDTFSYSLAHEIDNPMAIILGNSELLKIIVEGSGANEVERQEIFNYLDYIFEAATRVSAMVKAIYDFGKKDSGEYYHLKLGDVVAGFMHLSMPEFKHQRIVVSTDVPEEPIIIYGNTQHLIGVLRNFARNSMHALQYVDEKKINIKIERASTDLARLTFSDTGEGIEAEKIPIVFMPFVTTKASSEGSGMGLYYVKRIIDSHKGKVCVESAGRGKGASIILELPIAQGVTAEDLEKQEEPRKSRRKF